MWEIQLREICEPFYGFNVEIRLDVAMRLREGELAKILHPGDVLEDNFGELWTVRNEKFFKLCKVRNVLKIVVREVGIADRELLQL